LSSNKFARSSATIWPGHGFARLPLELANRAVRGPCINKVWRVPAGAVFGAFCSSDISARSSATIWPGHGFARLPLELANRTVRRLCINKVRRILAVAVFGAVSVSIKLARPSATVWPGHGFARLPLEVANRAVRRLTKVWHILAGAVFGSFSVSIELARSSATVRTGYSFARLPLELANRAVRPLNQVWRILAVAVFGAVSVSMKFAGSSATVWTGYCFARLPLELANRAIRHFVCWLSHKMSQN
jgi:glyoxylase-like metal-dependent hydrolase (beta-lactamase superfamily II)